MIQVYGIPPSRSLRVLWMLEELGLGYEVRPLDFMKRHEDLDFIRINPAAFVPVMIDGDVEMFESGAILQYLAERYAERPFAPRFGDANYPLYLQFLHFGEASVAAAMNVTIGSKFFGPESERDNYGAKLAVDMGVNRLVAVKKQLERTPYVAGEEFTAADISVAYAINLATQLGGQIDPAVKAYFDRLAERPAFARAMGHARQPA